MSFALQFQGYPYVYAGEGPYAFDCSGFTMFVIRNTLGIDVPHDMRVQYQMGRPVSRDALQPGDLVFFANTLHPGMSHNGIYIGGGQFIHAETESSGVRISDLDFRVLQLALVRRRAICLDADSRQPDRTAGAQSLVSQTGPLRLLAAFRPQQ